MPSPATHHDPASPVADAGRAWLRFGPAGRALHGSRPLRSLMLGRDRAEQLGSLPALLEQWFRDGVDWVAGAIAYDAGLYLHGIAPAPPGDGPLAVLTGYRREGAPRALSAGPREWRLSGAFRARQTQAEYLHSVAAIQRYLQAGDCYQVNLSQALAGRFQGDPLAGWRRLDAAHEAPFGGYLEWPGGALLSASPERFLRIHRGRVVTEPIKGSRPRGRDAAEDRALAEELYRSDKDRAENLMIVDLLRNDLGRVCSPGSIGVDRFCELRSFSNVHHLVSRVHGELRPGIRPLEALLACFPGGSITGAPKHRAMEIIDELEPVARGFYCGSLFWQDADGDFDSNILIRTLQAGADGTLLCHGGGGIVADSGPAAEYEESLFKVRALMEAVDNDP